MKHSASSPQAVLLRPRLYIGQAIDVGPGKIDLLKHIVTDRSISAAARAMGMTYKRAWLLIDSLNQGFGKPVVETSAGGKGGGGAALTPLGEALVAHFSALEKKLNRVAQAELAALRDLAS